MDANANAVEFEIVDNMNLRFRIPTKMVLVILLINMIYNGGSQYGEQGEGWIS